jgi:hypothetical protein
MARLTDVQIGEIRSRYKRGLGEQLAREYGISEGYLLRIVKGEKRKL